MIHPLDWSHHLSNLTIFVVIIGVMLVLTIGAPLLRDRLYKLDDDKDRNEGILDAFKAVISVCSFVLAFSLVQVQGNFRAAQDHAAREASVFTTLDRTLLRYGDPLALALRPTLRSYGEAIAHDEWPAMVEAQSSPTVDTLLTTLSRGARALEPQTQRQQSLYNDLLKSLDELQDARNQRLFDAEADLPNLFWDMIAGLMAVLVVLSSLITPKSSRLWLVGGLMVAVTLLLALVVVIDGPYSGETSVDPGALLNALKLAAARA